MTGVDLHLSEMKKKGLEANLRSEDWPLVSDSSRDAFLPAKDNHN